MTRRSNELMTGRLDYGEQMMVGRCHDVPGRLDDGLRVSDDIEEMAVPVDERVTVEG